jgi:hypothetical protein
MIYKRPFRFTTLHFEQRFRIDDETFINLTPSSCLVYPNSQSVDYTCQYISRPVPNQGRVRMSGSFSVIATECS